MVDVDKLVKGDKIITKDGSGFLILGFEHINWIKVREFYSDGTYSKKETGIYIPLANFEEFEKVYEWTDWRKYICPDGGVAYYKTNRKDIKFKRDNIETHCSCHVDDIFNLKFGLELCYNRWREKVKKESKEIKKMKNITTPKKINVNKLENKWFGDFVALKIVGKDKSRHNIWMCVCPICGEIIYATAYDLMHGRKKTTCKTCAERKAKAISESESATSGYISDVATTSTTWYSDGSTTTTYADYMGKDNTTYTDDDFNMPFTTSEEMNKINYREIRKDLLSYPVYYHIVHCIPADLTLHGKTARKINDFYNLERIFEEEYIKDFCGVGDVLWDSNVFTLLPNEAKFTKVEYHNLNKCLHNLAMYCVTNNIKYLAMPRICSGGNKLPWHEVKDMILEKFEDIYKNFGERASQIYIDFCYF